MPNFTEILLVFSDTKHEYRRIHDYGLATVPLLHVICARHGVNIYAMT